MQSMLLDQPRTKRPLFNPHGLFFPKANSKPVTATVAPVTPVRIQLPKICLGAGLTASALKQLFSAQSLH